MNSLPVVTDNIKNPAESAAVPIHTGQVTSPDGTQIGYRILGRGPGLVILHGGGRASQHYVRLGEALAGEFTVYIPDRRGRGLSGPAGDAYGLQSEIEDVSAVLEKTGARLLFGHSAGAVFALEAALELPIDRLLLYEPPVSINRSVPLDWLPACEKALAGGNPTAALVIFLKGLRLNWMSRLPFWVLYPMAALMLKDAEGREMVDLLPTALREAKESLKLDSNYLRYRKIKAGTLLMGGSRSPAYLRDVLPILALAIPHARVVEFPGLDHNAPDQYAPEKIAAEMRRFLSQEKSE